MCFTKLYGLVMTTSNPKTAFWTGFQDALPFVLVVSPFALLFGVVATEAGLNLVETMSFSVLVIAGAAQFTALQLMMENAPTVVVLVSALAVNLRMAMYSASLAPHFGKASIWQRAMAAYFTVDQSYALSILKYDRSPDMTVNEKLAYFFGSVAPVAPMWYAMTLVGALLGSAIPPEFALDFAVPITFIALVAPALRTPAHIVAAFISVSLALVFTGLPYNLGLLVAAVAAMMAGAQTELWQERRIAT